MPKMPMDQFLAEVEKAGPGHLRAEGASHEIVDGRVHLRTKDSPDGDAEIWIYPNENGTFTYQRGDETEFHTTIEGLAATIRGET